MAKNTRINVTLDFNADIKNINSAVGNIQRSLQGLTLPQNLNKNFLNIFSNLEAEIKNFSSLTNKELTTIGDFSAIDKSGKKILDLYRKLGIEIDGLPNIDKEKFFPPETIKAITKINSAMSQFNTQTSKNKKAIKEAKDQVAEYTAKIETQRKRIDNLNSKQQISDNDYKAKKAEIENQKKLVEELAQAYDEANVKSQQRMQSDGRETEDKRTKQYKEKIKLYQQLEQEQTKLQQNEAEFSNQIAISQYKSQMTKATEATNKFNIQIQQANEEIDKLGDGGEAEAFAKMMEGLKDIDGIDSSTIKSYEDLEQALSELITQALQKANIDIEKISAAFQETDAPVRGFSNNLEDAKEHVEDLERSGEEIDNLKRKLLDFFSIGNAVQLFKRSIKSAFDTVKELDKTMTEAAVVTDFSVGDMWSQLPTYSSQAKELGASINDLYGATTLYYQQGLKTREAMELGNETLKMARIGSIETGNATQYMTAALRGFNMEINQMSGEKVNDVYSELAAITAADTSQIAVAMSKTASIASSANMVFENTAAFLSQIIETTQEAPETAGTALKTIIARFSEVKKLVGDGLLSGTDDEGEVIDVNKISSALASVGISMNKFFAGNEGLDSVLMKLASKWDTLDFATQRYIATTAAGSRQQSRFIALMSNYDRTMELVNAANNSAGASQEQFNKTLESLDSKLNQLKDAWDEFVMGLANSDIIKGAIDLLTGFLDTINKIIDGLSGGNGIAKTLTTFFAAFGAFKLGKKALGQNSKSGILEQLLGNFGYVKKESNKTGQSIGQSLIGGIKNKIKDFKGKDFKSIISSIFTKNIPIQKNSPFDEVFNNLNDQQKETLQNSEQFRDAYLESLQKINSQFSYSQLLEIQDEYDTNGIDAANAKIKELGGTIQTTEQMSKIAGQSMGADFDNVAKAARAAGGVLMIIASILEKQGASSGLIDSIKAVGIALMLLPTIYSVVNTATKAFGIKFTATFLNIPVIGWIAAIITALIALANILATVIDTPEEKLNKANASVESATEAANKLSEAYHNINEKLEKIKSNEDAFDILIERTNEWKEALLENNQAILELIQENPELAAFVQNVDGRLVIDYERQNFEGKRIDQVVSDKLDASISASNNILAAQIEAFEAERIVGASDLKKITIPYNIDHKYITDESQILGDLALAQINLSDTNAVEEFLQKNYLNNFVEDQDGHTQLKSFALAISNNADAVNKFGASLIQNEETISAYTQLIADSFIDQYIKQANLTEEESAIVKDFGNEKRLNELADKIEDEIGNNIGKNENYIKFMKKSYDGIDITVENSGVIKDKEGNIIAEADTGKEMYSQSVAGEQMVKGAKSYLNAVSQIKNEATRAVLSGNDGKNTRINELQLIFGKDVNIADIFKDGKIEESEASQFVKELENIWTYLDEETKEKLYGSDMQRFIDEGMEKLSNATQTYANAINVQSELITKGATFQGTNNFTANELEGLNEVYQAVLSSSGTSGLKSVSDAMSNLLASGDISEQDQGKFLEIFNAITWTSATAIEDFKESLFGAGLSAITAGNNFNNLMEEMDETTVAIKTFSLGKIREETKNTADLVDELKNKKDSSFDEETKQRLLKLGADKNDFVWNGQEFIYIGGTMEDLAQAISDNTAAIMDNTIAQLENKIKQGEQFGEIFDKTYVEYTSEGGGFTKDDFINGKVTDSDAAISFMISGMSDEDEIADVETGKTYTKKDLLANDNEDLALRLYNQGYESFINLTENKDALVSTEQARAINERSTTEIRMAGESEELQRAASITEATKDGLDSNEVLNYANSLKEMAASYKEPIKLSDAMAAEIAKDNMVMNEGIKILADNWSIWGSALDKSRKGTSEYSTAMSGTKKAMQQILGTSADLSDEFIQNAKDCGLLEKAINGDGKAIDELRKASAKEIVLGVNYDTDGIDDTEQKILDLIDGFDGTDLEFGASLDETNLYQGFDDILTAGEMTAEQVQEALDRLGFEPQWEMETKELSDEDKKRGYVETPELDAYGQVTGTKKTPITSEMSVAGTYTIPKIVSKGNTKRATMTGTYKGSASATANSSKGSSGGGGSKKPEKQHWENPYDKLYNTVEQLNEALRQREKLERQYDILASHAATTAADMQKNLAAQTKELEKQRKAQQSILNGRKQQLKTLGSESYIGTKKNGKEEEQFRTTFAAEFKRLGLGNINDYITYDIETGLRELDWNRINKITQNETTGEDQGALIEAFVSKFEEISDQIEEAQDSLDDIEDSLIEIIDRQLESRIEFIETFADLLKEQDQKQIDKLSTLNDTINDTNNKILSGLQESIEESRQIRENTKTEEDIADKEARLAYLRRDTSGANDLEIMKLEEELSDARESYTDTLIDQGIDKLSKENEKAAQQREDQIRIMQELVDFQSENGYYSQMAKALSESEALTLWEQMKNYDNVTEEQKIKLMQAFNELWNKGGNNSSLKELAKADSMYQSQKYTLTDNNGKKHSVEYDEENDSWVTKDKKGKITYSVQASEIDKVDIEKNTLTQKKDKAQSESDLPNDPEPPKTGTSSASGYLKSLKQGKDGKVYQNGKDEIKGGIVK